MRRESEECGCGRWSGMGGGMGKEQVWFSGKKSYRYFEAEPRIMLTQLKSIKLPLALLFLKFLTLSLLPPWTGSLSIDAKYDYPGSQIYAGRSVLCRLRLQVQYPLRFSLSITCEIKFEWAGSLVFGPTIHAVHMIVCPLCNLRALENLNLVPYHRYSTLWKHVS